MPKRKLKGFQKYQPPVGKKSWEYRQVWRLVDGCVLDTFCIHPDYLTPKGMSSVRMSLVKRITGQIMSYVEGYKGKPKSSTRGRSGARPAATKDEA